MTREYYVYGWFNLEWGLLTVKEAMAEAGVGRTRWYELVREASLEGVRA